MLPLFYKKKFQVEIFWYQEGQAPGCTSPNDCREHRVVAECSRQPYAQRRGCSGSEPTCSEGTARPTRVLPHPQVVTGLHILGYLQYLLVEQDQTNRGSAWPFRHYISHLTPRFDGNCYNPHKLQPSQTTQRNRHISFLFVIICYKLGKSCENGWKGGCNFRNPGI